MRKIWFIILLVFCTIIVWAINQTGIEVFRNKITLKLWKDDQNPYLYNPKTKDLQHKLNLALSFNLQNYNPIRESGFWNAETEEALESFREFYYKKYKLQRYYTFSADSGMDVSTWSKAVNREAPDPTTLLRQNMQEMQAKLGDPAQYYGDAGRIEINRIEKGINGEVNPVSGALEKNITLYQTPLGSDHLIPIQLMKRYSSQLTGSTSLGDNWYLTENAALWYSFEKQEIVIQDNMGSYQKYLFHNNQFIQDQKDTSGGYFKNVNLSNGQLGDQNSIILVQTATGDTLFYKCQISTWGDSKEDIKREANKCSVIRGYVIDRNDDKPIKGGIYSNEINFASKEDQTIGLRNLKNEFLNKINSYITNSSKSGFSVTFCADNVTHTNINVFSFSQKSSTNDINDQFAGYQLDRIKNRYGAVKKYSYDTKGHLNGITVLAPDNKEVEHVNLQYSDRLLKSILLPNGSVNFYYQTNGYAVLLKKSVTAGDNTYASYDFSYKTITLENNNAEEMIKALSNLEIIQTNLIKHRYDTETSIENFNTIKAGDPMSLYCNETNHFLWYSGPALKDVYYTQAYIDYMKGILKNSLTEINKNYNEVLVQIRDIGSGKYYKRVSPISQYQIQTGSWKQVFKFDYASMDPKVFNLTNSEFGVRVSSVITPAGTALFEYKGMSTTFVDPNSKTYIFSVNNSDSGKDVYERFINGITYPDGASVSLTFNDKGKLTDLVNEVDQSYHYTYDTFGNVLGKNLPLNRSWIYEYKQQTAAYLGKPTRITQPDGSVYDMVYNDLGDMISKSLDGHLLSSANYVYSSVGFTCTTKDMFLSPTIQEYNAKHFLIKKTNPDGTVTTYINDEYGKALEETTLGVTIFQEYNGKGNLTAAGIKGVNSTKFVYDGLGRKVQEINGLNATLSTVYDPMGNVTLLTDPQLREINYHYDANGNRIEEDYGDWKILYSYDSKNKLKGKTQVDKGAFYETVMSYDPAGNMTFQAISGRGWGNATGTINGKLKIKSAIVSNSYSYNAFGQITEEINLINGEHTSYGIDSMGRITAQTNSLNGHVSHQQFTYDYLGRVKKSYSGSDDETARLIDSKEYGMNRTITSTDAYGNVTISFLDFRDKVTNLTYQVFDPISGQNIVYNHSYVFNAFGMKIKEIFPDLTVQDWNYENGTWLQAESQRHSASESPVWMTYINNKVGQPERMVDYNGNTWKKEFNYKGEIISETDPEGRIKEYTYDILGNRISQTIGNTTIHYEYSFFNKPVLISYPNGDKIQYRYDALGNQSYVKEGEYDPVFIAFDDNNNQIAALLPGGLILSNKFNSHNQPVYKYLGGENDKREWKNTYDVLGRLIEEIRPDGVHIKHSYEVGEGTVTETVTEGNRKQLIIYDQLQREIKRTIQDNNIYSGTPYAWYQGQGMITGIVYNKAGYPMVKIASGKNVIRYEYNPQGKVISEINALDEAKTYTYDKLGNLTSISDFYGNSFSYTYDKSGLLKSAKNPDGGQTFYNYDSKGSLKEKILPGGAKWLMTTDERGRVLTETNPLGGTASYTYDVRGNKLSSINPDGGRYVFKYDKQGRLVETQKPGNGPGDSYIQDYTYTVFSETNRIIFPDMGAVEFTYDMMGRVVHKKQGAWSTSGEFNGTVLEQDFTYTPNGLLETASYPSGMRETYSYTTSGLPVSRIITTNGIKTQEIKTGYALSGQQPYGEVVWTTDSGGITTRSYSDSLGRVTNRTETSGNETRQFCTTYTREDGLQVEESWKYDPVKNTRYDWSRVKKDFRGNIVSKSRLYNNSILEIWKSEYNAAGQMETESFLQDAEKNIWLKTTYIYDLSQGVLKEKQEASGLKTIFQYDTMSRPVSKNESGRITTITYHPNGKMSGVYIGNISGKTYEYDYRGNVIHSTDLKSKTEVTIDYDIFSNKKNETVHWGGDSLAKRYIYNAQEQLYREINELGGIKQYTYNSLGLTLTESRIITNNGIEQVLHTTAFQYTPEGRLDTRSETDHILMKSYKINFKYDNWGNLTNTIYPDSSMETAVFDIWGQKASATDRFGYSMNSQYDEYGQLVSQTMDTLGGILNIEYRYDTAGNKIYEKAGQKEMENVYDNRGLLLKKKVKTETGWLVNQFNYDPYGRKISETDYEGNTSIQAYDDLDRVIKTISPMGKVVEKEYSYDANGQTIEKQIRYNGSVKVSTKTVKDGFGLVKEESDATGNKTTYNYSHTTHGREMVVTDKEGNKSLMIYDSYDRLTESIDPYGNSLKNEYDGAGNTIRVTDKAGTSWTKEYDWQGRVILSRNALGDQDITRYDVFINNDPAFTYKGGELRTVTDAEGNTTRTLSYDKNVLQYTDALGHKTSYQYDNYGQLIETTDPKGNKNRIGYDLRGNVVQRKTPLGFTTKYSYDKNSRQTLEDNGPEWIQTVYDRDGNISAKIYRDGNKKVFNYDSLGRLVSASDKSSSYEYQYDDNDRLLSKKDLKTGTIQSFTYDKNGQRTGLTTGKSLQNPDKTVIYKYDALGRINLETVVDGPSGSATNLMVAYSYNAMNRVTNKVFSTGLKTVYQYDALHRLTAVINYSNKTIPLSALRYTYDKVGNRLTETRVESTNTLISRFIYDAKYQLVDASYGNELRETFSYDATGNRTFKTSIRGLKTESVRYVYDNDNRMMAEQFDGSITQYTYDQAGRIVQKRLGGTVESFEYDSRDLMKRYIIQKGNDLNVAEYGYDVENHRITKKDDSNLEFRMSPQTVESTWDGDNLLTEGGSFYLNNIMVNGYEAQISSIRTAVFLKDAAGSIRGELYDKPVSINGITAGFMSRDYTAFGESLKNTENPSLGNSETGNGSNLGFTGHYFDSESGLYYARARYYDPRTGRFQTRDPLNDTSPTGLNKYMYANNNPIMLWDPMGESVWGTLIAVVAGVIVGLFNPIAGLAVAGAIMGMDAGIEGAMAQGGGALNIFLGALIGGVIGGLAGGLTGGLASTLGTTAFLLISSAVMAGIGAISNITGQLIAGGASHMQWGSVLRSTIEGALVGMAVGGAALAGETIMGDLYYLSAVGPYASALGGWINSGGKTWLSDFKIEFTVSYGEGSEPVNNGYSPSESQWIDYSRLNFQQTGMPYYLYEMYEDAVLSQQQNYLSHVRYLGRMYNSMWATPFGNNEKASIDDVYGFQWKKIYENVMSGNTKDIGQPISMPTSLIIDPGMVSMMTVSGNAYYGDYGFNSPQEYWGANHTLEKQVASYIPAMMALPFLAFGGMALGATFTAGELLVYAMNSIGLTMGSIGLGREITDIKQQGLNWNNAAGVLLNLGVIATSAGKLIKGIQYLGSEVMRWTRSTLFRMRMQAMVKSAIADGMKFDLQVFGADDLMAAESGGGLDLVQGTGRLGGKLYGPDRMNQLANYLEKRNIKLILDDPMLDSRRMNGAFNRVKGELLLRSDATEYEVWHELSHYIQYRQIGPEAYSQLTRSPTYNEPEEFVLQMLAGNNRRWIYQLNQAERDHAIWYILKTRGK